MFNHWVGNFNISIYSFILNYILMRCCRIKITSLSFYFLYFLINNLIKYVGIFESGVIFLYHITHSIWRNQRFFKFFLKKIIHSHIKILVITNWHIILFLFLIKRDRHIFFFINFLYILIGNLFLVVIKWSYLWMTNLSSSICFLM